MCSFHIEVIARYAIVLIRNKFQTSLKVVLNIHKGMVERATYPCSIAIEV